MISVRPGPSSDRAFCFLGEGFMRHALLLLSVSTVVLAAPKAKQPMTAQVDKLKAELLKKHGEAQKDRIDRGSTQLGANWRADDGDLVAFGLENFIADPKQLDDVFERLETQFEQLDGHF